MKLLSSSVNTVIWSLICVITLITLTTSCTYSVAMNHSEGTASDVIDEAATVSPTTTVSVPPIKVV